MNKTFNYYVSVIKAILYVALYYISLVGGIYIIGFVNIGIEPIEDVFRIGKSIVSVQSPWMLMLNLLIFMVIFSFFIKEKIKHKDWYAFEQIPFISKLYLIIIAFVLNIVVSKIVTYLCYSDAETITETIKNLGDLYPVILVINTGFIVPILEELLFRFLIFNSLEPLGFTLATVFSSVLFGIMHGILSQIIYAIIFGIIFCFTNKTFKSIRPSIIMHCAINIITVSLVLLKGG